MELSVAVALASGFFLIGGVAILRSLLAIVRGYASRQWPQTTGTISESRVEELINADGQLMFFPQVQYRYTVGENKYESTNIRFPTESFASRRRAEAIIAKYPVASSVLVSYCSEKPVISVLEPGLTRNAFTGVVIGLGFLSSSVFGCYYFLLVQKP